VGKANPKLIHNTEWEWIDQEKVKDVRLYQPGKKKDIAANFVLANGFLPHLLTP
jgi:hypothetical protein